MKYIVCFFIGSLYTLSFSPYNIQILSVVSIVTFLMLLDLDNIKDAIIKSSLFAFGYFLIGTYWLQNVISSYSDANNFLNIFFLLIFIIYLSLYFVLPIIFSCILKKKLGFDEGFILIILSVLITIFEIFRSLFFTGFSWFNFGQSGLATPFISFYPVIGVHGVTFLIFLISVVILNIIKNNNKKFFLSIVIFLFVTHISIFSKDWTIEGNEKINISIIQPNNENKLSYTKNEIKERMDDLYTITLGLNQIAPDIILWPEAVIPVPFNNINKNYYDSIRKKISNTSVLVAGSFFLDNNIYYNSIINISNPNNIYHKKHLVPFGEYLPFRNFLSRLYSYVNLSFQDITTGETSNNIKVGKFEAYASICYESIFSLSSLVKNSKSSFIINVSNDGWFGDSLAPYQHLDALRLRSIENQRYSIRAANSGISAVISPSGDLLKNIPFQEKGVINAEIVERNGYTPLSEHGYKILYLFMFLIFLYSAIFFNRKAFKI
jgi:apolipoprotein N-acyltransferase